MEVIPTPLDGLVVLRPRIFADARGEFLETFNARTFQEQVRVDVTFVQDNESTSAKNVLRGLHYQIQPHAQGKLVHVVHGAVLDVCLDIRKDSATYGQHFMLRLTGATKEMLWIPAGFAHGFVALEDGSTFAYKCTDYYHPASERTILWNDPALAIDWGVRVPLISAKDEEGQLFSTIKDHITV